MEIKPHAQWFSINDVLPTEDDADEDGHVLAISKDIGKVIVFWQDVIRFKEYISYWTHMPRFSMEAK